MKNLFSIIAITAFLFLSVHISFAQTPAQTPTVTPAQTPVQPPANKENVLEKGTDEYKMFMAKQDFFGGDYHSAVNKFKEILKNRPNDAVVQFYIGDCYFMMHEYKDALEFLETAKKMDPAANDDLSLMLGRTYHQKGMIDKALAELNTYRKSVADNSKKLAESDVDVYISQCTVAKQLMAKPVNVKLIQLVDINSIYEDKGPVLTNGDKTLIFTSRRPAGDKSKTDKEGDFGYFDDVYESNWSDEKKTWLAADMIRGPINTPGYDACTSISNDGKLMFIYRNDPTEARGGEIFMSKKTTSGKWKTPEILLKPINTSYYEDAACISPDGNTLYFVSERPGGLGHGDIYVSKKSSEGWTDPVNIGAPVNSAYDENGLYLTSDGKTLFFCSNGPASMGSYDIFRTTIGTDGKWSVPVNVGYPINTVGMESKFVMTADKKTAYISTVRDSGLGERDIMMIDMTYYNVMSGVSSVAPPPAPKPARLMGKITNAEGAPMLVEIKILDKSTGTQAAITKAGQDGSYFIEFAGDKSYILEATSDGFQKVSMEISVPAAKTESKDIILIKNN